jgi:hypothetical protein
MWFNIFNFESLANFDVVENIFVLLNILQIKS